MLTFYTFFNEKSSNYCCYETVSCFFNFDVFLMRHLIAANFKKVQKVISVNKHISIVLRILGQQLICVFSGNQTCKRVE